MNDQLTNDKWLASHISIAFPVEKRAINRSIHADFSKKVWPTDKPAPDHRFHEIFWEKPATLWLGAGLI